MIQKKVCVLGASAVGKTSLIKQYIEGIFSEKYLTSIGVKVDKKIVDVGSTSVQLMIWDIEGVDRYASFNPKFLRGAAAAIVVVDHARLQSFFDGDDIIRLVKSEADIPIVLVKNKCDLVESGSLDSFDSEAISFLSAEFNTSAKTGEGVEDMFQSIASLVLNKKVE